MKKGLLILFLLLPGLRGLAQTETNKVDTARLRLLLNEARTFYQSEEEGALPKAAERFRSLKEAGQEGEFNQDALRLAEGLSLLRAGQPQQALEALEEVEGFESAFDRSRHRLLKGTAQLQVGEQQAEEQQWDPAEESVGDAIESLTNSLKENPESAAARHNLELAHRRLYTIREQRPKPTPTPAPTPTPTPGPTPTPTPEPSGEPTPTPTPDPEAEENGEQENGEQQEPEDGEDSSQSEQTGEEQQNSEGGELSEEEVDAQEARKILEAYLEQEKRQRRQILEQQRLRSIPVEKDW